MSKPEFEFPISIYG